MNNNTEIFTPDNLTVKKIFGDADSFYSMPIYQRPYAWDKERVEQLWYDVHEAYKNHTENPKVDVNYFLGSIVVVKNSDSYEVIDGQQRLTTLTILFCVLRDLYKNSKDINLIKNSIYALVENKERLKLTTHLNNQTLFDDTVLAGINFDKPKKEIKDNRFLQTAYIFKELIEKAQDENDEDFIENFDGLISYLFNKTTMIKVVCYDEGFAIKLFTVLNDRGLDLSPADIIKAYMLQKLEESKRTAFIEVWKQIESLIDYSDENLQGLFNLYLYYLKTENPRKSLQDELKEQLKDKDPQKVILDIKQFGEKYLALIGDRSDKKVSMLRYLKHSIYWKAILTTAKHTSYPQIKELKSLLVKYFYQSWIAGGTANRVKQTAFKILKLVKAKEPISKVKEAMENNISKFDSYLPFLDSNTIIDRAWLKPLLLTIEYHQNEDKDFIPISKDLHIEHILPREWNAEGLKWSEFFTSEEAKQKVNSLGNLTLLSGTKNIRASNRNFADKREIYKGNNGKGFDGKTGFEITKKVIDEYETWSPKNLDKRFSWLKNQTQTILDI